VMFRYQIRVSFGRSSRRRRQHLSSACRLPSAGCRCPRVARLPSGARGPLAGGHRSVRRSGCLEGTASAIPFPEGWVRSGRVRGTRRLCSRRISSAAGLLARAVAVTRPSHPPPTNVPHSSDRFYDRPARRSTMAAASRGSGISAHCAECADALVESVLRRFVFPRHATALDRGAVDLRPRSESWSTGRYGSDASAGFGQSLSPLRKSCRASSCDAVEDGSGHGRAPFA
jgi:hypothetical protein